MQHDFGYTTSQKDADGWVILRTVGQHIHNPRNLAVNIDPVLDTGPLQSGSVSDGWNMQKQVCRSAKCRVYGHGIVDGFVGQYLPDGEASFFQANQRTR